MWVLLFIAISIPTLLHFRSIQQLRSVRTYVQTQVTVEMKTQPTLFFLIVVIFYRSSFNTIFFFNSLLYSSFVFGTPSHELRKLRTHIRVLHTKNYAKKKWPRLLALYYPKIRNQFCTFCQLFFSIAKTRAKLHRPL